jgi:UDP-3-O-[3-hydroxymyristoyl] glucosamine N-acyltransferase
MEHPGFFERAAPKPLGEVATVASAELAAGAEASRLVSDIRPLDLAGPGDVSFIDNRKYLSQLDSTRAGACLVAPQLLARVPASTIPLVTPEPYRAFARVLTAFYPRALHPRVAEFADGSEAGGVHPSARIEEGAVIEAGAIIGREARIGRGTTVAAGAVIGYRVTVGRGGFIGPHASLTHALVGDRVIIHAGARIGQDGFGFAMGAKGHLKVPQIGRVIIQDDVEVGANSTIDRGALKDTIIGEGTKIDNLVQIAHNVVIGRHCVICALVGIAGSAVLEDFVVLGGQTGVNGHSVIGAGTQAAAQSGIPGSLPRGSRVGGSPAHDTKLWAREIAALKLLAKRKSDR